MANTLKFGNGEWAIKEGSALAYNDENGNFKPLPFDFTRASTATYVAKDGLIKTAAIGEPRIDFLDDSEGALLLEPQRTNINTYSEDTPQNYVATEISDTFGYSSSPNGLQTSTRLQLSNLGSSRYVHTLTGIVSSGTVYNFSCYYKGTQGETAYMYALPVGGTAITKAITFTGEWQRENLTFTAGSASNYVYIVDSRQGGDASDFEVWGAQVELGSYPTSYIPTQGSTVTRVQDVCYNNNIGNVIGQTEGTFYIETIPLASTTSFTERIIQFESSGSDFITFQRYANSNLTFYGTDGSNSWTIQGSNLFVGGETIKIAGAYKDNDIVLYANGVQIGTNNTANAPQVDRMWFANNANGSLAYSGSHKEVKFYNTRLSNSELEELTTL